jgi:hypothetical protein
LLQNRSQPQPYRFMIVRDKNPLHGKTLLFFVSLRARAFSLDD